MTTATLPRSSERASTAAPTPAGTGAAPAAAPRAAAAAHRAYPPFTLDGDDALEQHLGTACDRIAAGLRGLIPASRLQAVLLGGGYGRGEGGVLRTPAGDQPYNDMEFYVFLRGSRHVNERLYGRALHVLGEILTPQAGVDVEFRITSLPELAGAGVTMYSYDLVCGHRWLVGDEPLLSGCGHHRNAAQIPIAEAMRLLMNRATGLLLAQERMKRTPFTPNDADFVARNIAKAQLGAGDAVLTALAQYHWRVRERHRRLQRPGDGERAAWFGELCTHHAAGVEFKLHPTRSTADRADLALRHAAVSKLCRDVWLWLESRRLKTALGTVTDYVRPSLQKAPDLAGVRAVATNAKVFGAGAALRLDGRRHPRERVLNTLPLLLWQPDAITSPALVQHLQKELRTAATDFAGLLAAYRRIWEKVN